MYLILIDSDIETNRTDLLSKGASTDADNRRRRQAKLRMAPNSPTAASSTPDALPNLAAFSADPPDFNPVLWLNTVLSQTPTLPLQSLLSLLQDSILDAHNTLDTSLKQALATVPWVVRETDKVRQRANLLRANVDGVGQRVEGVETGVASSVTTIADADTIVRRVQHATVLLSQAVDAERLLARLDALLASSAADGSDLVSAADVVSQLRATLAPLKPIPELADRFRQLDAADRSLEALAAPQLLKALEARNTQMAANARIVFDHAGRERAFQTQYVALRGDQVAALWAAAWEPKRALDDSDGEGTAPRAEQGVAGDLAGVGAEAAVVAFYGGVYELVKTEADWLKVAFPDLRDELLPALICEAVRNLQKPVPVANVYFRGTNRDDPSEASAIAERLFGVAIASVTAAARLTSVCLPDGFGEDEGDAVEAELRKKESADGEVPKGMQVVGSIADAMTAVLGPFSTFWSNAGQIAVRQARTTGTALSLPSLDVAPERSPVQSASPHGASATRATKPAIRYRPPLGNIAKDLESCTPEVLSQLDTLLSTINRRTVGVGISAMKQATSTLSSVLADRFLRALRLPTSTAGLDEDEWVKVNGALRLLCATSALKRSWDARKESLFAVAVGTATPVLEVASVVQDSPVKRIEQFLSQTEGGNPQEAGIVWELVRDNKLTGKVVTEFEALDSAQDLQNLVDSVHRVAYDAMFAGVKERFSSFSNRDLWSSKGNDGEASMLGFSSSPLGYATEVADYLMTVPQQLEPFVPDEEDAKYATPRSPYAFSKAGTSSGHKQRRGSAQDETEEEDENEDANVSFAGMWISLLAIGTMELYVEKICSIPRLSEAGTRQLATDADYICNVIASLGVAPTREMALICRLLDCNGDSSSFKEAAAEYTSAEERKICRKVAAVRGLSVII